MTLMMVVIFSACQPKGVDAVPENNNLEGSLESILEKIYETADIDDSFKDYIKNGLQTTEIKSEDAAYFLGKEGIEFESAIAKEGADIEKIKKDIKENVDPRKWICVGVDPSNVIVDNIGDVVILIMSDKDGAALHDAFLKLKEK